MQTGHLNHRCINNYYREKGRGGDDLKIKASEIFSLDPHLTKAKKPGLLSFYKIGGPVSPPEDCHLQDEVSHKKLNFDLFFLFAHEL